MEYTKEDSVMITITPGSNKNTKQGVQYLLNSNEFNQVLMRYLILQNKQFNFFIELLIHDY